MPVAVKTNHRHFSSVVNAFVPDAEENALEFVQLLALKVFRQIILLTPVDTGRARGNWQIDVGSSPMTQVAVGRGNSRARAGRQVANAVPVVEKAKLGDTIYIANNLPYISLLEEGSSKQAPHGMVERAMAQVGRAFKRGGATLGA